MSLTIGHANVHNSARGVKFMLGLGVDSLDLQEVYSRIGLIKLLSGRKYRMVLGEGAQDSRRGPKDNPILTKKAYVSLGQIAVQGSPKSTPIKIAPERWMHASLFIHPTVGKVAHIGLHPHAAVKDLDAEKSDRAAKYDENMRRLRALIGLLETLGFKVVATMDANLPRNALFGGLTPYEVFRQCEMDFHSTEIDVVAWNGNDLKLSNLTRIGKSKLDSDHNGFVARFDRP